MHRFRLRFDLASSVAARQDSQRCEDRRSDERIGAGESESDGDDYGDYGDEDGCDEGNGGGPGTDDDAEDHMDASDVRSGASASGRDAPEARGRLRESPYFSSRSGELGETTQPTREPPASARPRGWVKVSSAMEPSFA